MPEEGKTPRKAYLILKEKMGEILRVLDPGMELVGLTEIIGRRRYLCTVRKGDRLFRLPPLDGEEIMGFDPESGAALIEKLRGEMRRA